MTVTSMKAELAMNSIIKELATSLKARKSIIETLLLFEHIFCIYHLVWFNKNQAKV